MRNEIKSLHLRKLRRKTIKVKLTENEDEISIDIMKCTTCNYQSTLSELTYGK